MKVYTSKLSQALLTNHDQDGRKIASLLCRGRPAPDGGGAVLPHPAVYLHVHEGQVGEGDDARGEEPRPVDVVVHVVGIQSIEEENIPLVQSIFIVNVRGENCLVVQDIAL